MKLFKTLPIRSVTFFVFVLAAAITSLGCSDSTNESGSTGNPLGAYQQSGTSTSLPTNGQTTGVGVIDSPIVSVPGDGENTDHTNAPLLNNYHPGWQQGDCFGCHTDQSRIPDHSYADTSLCYLCHGTNGLPGFDDKTPPIVKGIVANTTPYSVTIRWTTDEPCISRLIVRTKQGDRLEFPVSTEYVTSHKYTVNGLLANTTYSYEIIATDKNRNVTSTASMATLNFTTLAATTTTTTTTGTTTGSPSQEFFGEIKVEDIKEFTAKISWTTKTASTCTLYRKYTMGNITSQETPIKFSTPATTFSVEPNFSYTKMDYTVYVIAKDAENVEYTSKEVTFTLKKP